VGILGRRGKPRDALRQEVGRLVEEALRNRRPAEPASPRLPPSSAPRSPREDEDLVAKQVKRLLFHPDEAVQKGLVELINGRINAFAIRVLLWLVLAVSSLLLASFFLGGQVQTRLSQVDRHEVGLATFQTDLAKLNSTLRELAASVCAERKGTFNHTNMTCSPPPVAAGPASSPAATSTSP
jgi:hypothetical protein